MASTGEVWKLGHRPALDGVRGIAILAVLAGHYQIPGAQDHGRTGVAVFFTLSGFLITSLLLQEQASSGRICLRDFYRRRFRRLAPAQIVCVATVALVGLPMGAAFLTPHQAITALLYVKDFYPTSDLLGHFWTLAVEEQFYLLWAPALIVALRLPRVVQCGAGAAVTVFAAVLPLVIPRLVIGGVDWAALTACGLSLLVGCGLAMFMRTRGEGESQPRLVAVGGVAVIGLVAMPWLDSPVVAAGSLMLYASAVATAAMIYGAAQGAPVAWLSGRWLVLVGQRSYGLYLWHFPILVLTWTWLPASWVTGVCVALPVTVVTAGLSWHYVERPFMRRGSVRGVEPAQGETDEGVVLPSERLHLGDDLRVRR